VSGPYLDAGVPGVHAIYPSHRVSLWSAFHVLFVAEGFVAADEPVFLRWCRVFERALLDTPPFGLLKSNQHVLALWGLFVASQQAGPVRGPPPGATAFRSTYDPGTGTLTVDESDLAARLGAARLPGPGGTSIEATRLLKYVVAPYDGLVVVLLPPSAGGAELPGELDANPHGLTTGAPSYVAVTADPGWERVVVRALARCFGLGDEFSRADGTPPPDLEAIKAGFYANLLAGPLPAADKPPPEEFKWYRDLSFDARTQPVPVIPFGGSPPSPPRQIALFEGGGGYRSKVYRSAADCVMRRRIGGGADSPRQRPVPFCTVCDHFLMRAISGTDSRKVVYRLDRQETEYDRVEAWAQDETVTSFPVTRAKTGRTPNAAGPCWSYTIKAGPAIETGQRPYAGLLIEDLKLLGQTQSKAEPTVAKRIEYRDVVVFLDDGAVVPFDFAAAFANTSHPPRLVCTQNGRLSADLTTDYLRGLKLTLWDDLGGRCLVRLECTLVLQGENTDFDPGGQIFAVEFFPQIALTWHGTGSGRRVTQFQACVRLVLNNRGIRDPDPHGHAPPEDETVASLFTDTNLEGITDRDHQLDEGRSRAYPLSRWAFIFDYYKPHLATDTEVWAVYGPHADVDQLRSRRADRTGELTWPPGSATNVLHSRKVAGQGAYDNIHMHWSMAMDEADPQRGAMVHAPGCAEACFHLHWRYGYLVNVPIIPRNWRFKGWTGEGRGPGPGTPTSNTVLGAPLIPPNQDLWVAVTHPSTERSLPFGRVVGGDPLRAVNSSTTALDKFDKAVWYTVMIGDPREGARQVLLEQGMSLAYKYCWDATLLRMTGLYVQYRESLWGMDREELVHRNYSNIRWYFDTHGEATSEQIPPGGRPVGSGVPLEEL
jgi:hypothetical protein